MYAIPISTVETLERKVRSLEEEYKVSRAIEVMQYRDSSDPKLATAGSGGRQKVDGGGGCPGG